MSSGHIDRLEIVLRQSPNPSEPEVHLALVRLSSEVQERLRQGSAGAHDFFLATVRALSRIKGIGHAELRLASLLDCACYFDIAGHFLLLANCANLAVDLASRIDQPIWIRRSQTILGIAYADNGGVANALVHYSIALEAARRACDMEGEAAVWVNIGTALNYAGLYREAIPCFSRAIELPLGDAFLKKVRASAYSNIAQSYMFLDEFEFGQQAIDKCLSLSSEPASAAEASSRTIREFTKVQLCLELNDIHSALQHSAICKKSAMWGNTPRSRILSQIAEGMCNVWAGNVDAGIVGLQRTLDETASWASMRTDALVALVKSYELIGDSSRALESLRALMTHIRDMRQRSVQTLLSVSAGAEISGSGRIGSKSLGALEHREAQLRAKVAENELQTSRIEMLERLAVTADLREEASGEHGYRVGKLSALLAQDAGWERDVCWTIEVAARLHDIGKIGVPDRILLNTQELKDAERHFMSAHALIGSEMLAKSNIPQLRMAEEIARCHHEWWNGTGYPAKKSGKRIPISARIVALADVFDALTHGRPYEQAWPIDRALDQIRSLRGEQFDPDLTDRFLDLIERLRKEHSDLDEFLGRAGRNSPFLQARNKIRDMLTKERDQEREPPVKGNETRH